MISRQNDLDGRFNDLGTGMSRERGRQKSFMTRVLVHREVVRAPEPSACFFGAFLCVKERHSLPGDPGGLLLRRSTQKMY
jgi:hypothetical protein